MVIDMKKMDSDGILLCELQGATFELSLEKVETSSPIFIRRFMNSEVVILLDNGSILQTNLQPQDIIEYIEEEYHELKYGKEKYTNNEMYWIGYLYRYFSYTYELSSYRVYKMVKPKELRNLYLPYHTLSVEQAIERILEAENIQLEVDDIHKQLEIYKKIRKDR